MASPATLALRARMGALQPAEIPVPVERAPKTMLRGDYAALLAQSVARTNRLHRARQAEARARNDAARAIARTIPASGPGRRRAKALRNAREGAETEPTEPPREA